jgi:hypothetical protein
MIKTVVVYDAKASSCSAGLVDERKRTPKEMIAGISPPV